VPSVYAFAIQSSRNMVIAKNLLIGAEVRFERRAHMQRYFGALTIILLLGTVWVRVLLMRRKGIEAMNFGRVDKKDFVIPPFALFYFYIVFAAAFNFPTVSRQELFHSEWSPG
jgi:hypothetical protein